MADFFPKKSVRGMRRLSALLLILLLLFASSCAKKDPEESKASTAAASSETSMTLGDGSGADADIETPDDSNAESADNAAGETADNTGAGDDAAGETAEGGFADTEDAGDAGHGDETGGSEAVSLPSPLYDSAGLMTDSESYCVLDENGAVLLSKNAGEALAPASVTKVLTALITVENVPDLSAPVTVSEAAVLNVDVLSSGVSPSLRPGEVFTVSDLLYMLILPSTNAAANVLAEYVAGSEEAFTDLMNARAKELGAVNSHFANAHGLDEEGHYSCAYDQALILKKAMEYPALSAVLSASSYTVPATDYAEERTVTAGHQMVNGSFPAENVTGGKPGWTYNAQGTLVTAYERAGKKLYVAVMRSDESLHYIDTDNLAILAYNNVLCENRPLHAVVKDLTVISTGWEGLTVSFKTGNAPVSARIVFWDTDAGTSSAVFNDTYVPAAEQNYTFPFVNAGVYNVQIFVTGEDGREAFVSKQVLYLGTSLAVFGALNSYGEDTYYVNGNGLVESNFVELPGHCFYAGTDGRIRKSCFVNDYRYYADENGEIVTGWRDIGAYTYYFQADGRKVTGAILLGGTVYHFDINGALE